PISLISCTRSAPHLTLPPFPTRRSSDLGEVDGEGVSERNHLAVAVQHGKPGDLRPVLADLTEVGAELGDDVLALQGQVEADEPLDRKSTRLNSSHVSISYAVFCLKKKTI